MPRATEELGTEHCGENDSATYPLDRKAETRVTVSLASTWAILEDQIAIGTSDQELREKTGEHLCVVGQSSATDAGL